MRVINWQNPSRSGIMIEFQQPIVWSSSFQKREKVTQMEMVDATPTLKLADRSNDDARTEDFVSALTSTL